MALRKACRVSDAWQEKIDKGIYEKIRVMGNFFSTCLNLFHCNHDQALGD